MRRIVSILLLLCVFFTADALEVKDITVKNISTEQGLSHHSVNTIYQDEFGFIWVGTLDGLNRYDGHRFKVFKPDSNNPHSIRENNIRHVCGDGNGHLYIKGLNSLSEFDMRTQKFRMLAEDGVKAIFHDGKSLWISDTKRLSVYNKEEDRFDEVFSFLKENMPEAVISRFTIGRDGKQYVSTLKDGIFVISDSGTIIRHLNVRDIYSLFEDSRGYLWCATVNAGVYLFMPNGNIQHFRCSGNGREEVVFNNVRHLCEDSGGNIWMSTYGGLVKLEVQSGRMIHYRYEFQHEAFKIRSVSPIFYDNQGTLWLGSFHNGLSTYNPGTEKYSWYQAKRDVEGRLNSPLISSIDEGENGSIFIGTEGGWVSMLDPKTGLFERLPVPTSLYDMTVKALLYNAREKMLYVSNLFGNVTRISLTGGKPSIFSVPEGVDRMSNIVSMTEYGKDTLLLATSEGVKIFDKRNGGISALETGFKSNYIRQVWDIETDGDNIWFTTSSDLYCYNIRNRMTRRHAFSDVVPGAVNNHFNHILKDSRGRLWFGSSGSGIFRYDRETDALTALGGDKTMSGSMVTALCEDPVSGAIYAATNRGLVSYDPDSGDLKRYDISTNFPLVFIRNMFITSDGELFVCNLDGMVSVRCSQLQNQPRDYDVFVSGVMVDNVPCVPAPEDSRSVLKEDIVFQNEISLTPQHSSVTFEISCTDYLNMSDAKVEYKLDGFDSGFISGSVSSPITYTNLSPGKYTFLVRGQTPDKDGNYPGSKIDVVVDVPFYKTIWFILLIAITLSVIILYILRAYVSSERLRSQNSTNESKLRFFTNISHEFRTPLTLINGQLEILLQQDNLKPSVYSRILSIYRNASTMNNLVNEIVDMMKSEAGKLKLKVARHDMVSFLKEIYVTFDEYARQRNIDLSFESDCERIFLEFDNRQLEKVFFNLLSNAFKYTSSGEGIRIIVGKVSDGVEIKVRDNGTGIKPEHIGHIFDLFYQDDKLNASLPGLGSGIGLSLSKAIVEMHGGNISVESTPGEGTCFTVMLKYNPVFSGEVVMIDDACDGMRPVLTQYKQDISAAVQSDGNEKGVKMLVVEDSEEITGLLVSVFSPIYDVKTASCGEEGLALARKEVPDIIVSDVMMPGMSGIEMCRILKDNIETSHIPIVLLTAYALENYVVEGFSMGADDYVTKPFNVKILVARCENLVRGRRRLQEKYQNLPETQVSILSTNTKDQTLLEKAVSIVMEHIDDPEFKIDIFAHELGLSRTYLFSKIKGLTGQSPNEFITTIRLKEAVVRLVGSKEESISEIAYSLGFSSSSYFINCFKARYGKTPAQYRKEYNN